MAPRAEQWLPALQWLRGYDRAIFGQDALAAVIVTIMLIPQSLAYAMLAGVPAEMGLYASMLPLVAYALFGTSRTLSVGPVAVVSLMTAAAIGATHPAGSGDYVAAAIVLALLSGLMLVLMGLLRFGMLANFLSHPVVASFITASGIIIALGQLRHLLGADIHGDNLVDLVSAAARELGSVHGATLVVGLASLGFLAWARRGMGPLLQKLGIRPALAGSLARASPVVAVIATTLAAWLLGLGERGVALVGEVPGGFPPLGLPRVSPDLWLELAGPALMISIIGYVESVSVGRTLAAKRRQRIEPNQELIGLGTANIAAGISGGFPVTGGFARSVVNFDAGAVTPAASILTAGGIALAALVLTPVLAFLPKATLAATIMVAVMSLVDFSILFRAWRYARTDFTCAATTLVITLLLGVEMGVVSGVLMSILLHLYKTTRPHIAVVGQVPGTEHFRNVNRHRVITHPAIISLRVDESLYFANISYIEDTIYHLVAENPEANHVVLVCTAVNEIDLSALEALEEINQRLGEQGIGFHLSEVKGPVMDHLSKTDFLQHLNGKVYLSQHQAMCELAGKEAG